MRPNSILSNFTDLLGQYDPREADVAYNWAHSLFRGPDLYTQIGLWGAW